jgi:hypothetical protein
LGIRNQLVDNHAKFYVQILQSSNSNQFFLKNRELFFLKTKKVSPKKWGTFFAGKKFPKINGKLFSGKYLRFFPNKTFELFSRKKIGNFFSEKNIRNFLFE